MATRCCSPPESSIGRWSARSARPTEASASRARSFACPRDIPAYSAASATFSSAVSVGTRLNDWNTKPIERRPDPGPLAVRQGGDRLPSIEQLGGGPPSRSGAWSRPRRCIRVLLPGAGRPHDRHHLAGRDADVHAAQGVEAGAPRSR